MMNLEQLEATEKKVAAGIWRHSPRSGVHLSTLQMLPYCLVLRDSRTSAIRLIATAILTIEQSLY